MVAERGRKARRLAGLSPRLLAASAAQALYAAPEEKLAIVLADDDRDGASATTNSLRLALAVSPGGGQRSAHPSLLFPVRPGLLAARVAFRQNCDPLQAAFPPSSAPA